MKKEKQKQYGVVGIRISLTRSEYGGCFYGF